LKDELDSKFLFYLFMLTVLDPAHMERLTVIRCLFDANTIINLSDIIGL